MNGTTTNTHGRSVQLAVMAAPSASVAEAVAEARRRHVRPSPKTSALGVRVVFSPHPAAG